MERKVKKGLLVFQIIAFDLEVGISHNPQRDNAISTQCVNKHP